VRLGAAFVNLQVFGTAADTFGPAELGHEHESGNYRVLTVRRLRPFARRRLSTNRPFFEAIRTRNPWVLRLWRVFG
jgi:hypothetical protein